MREAYKIESELSGEVFCKARMPPKDPKPSREKRAPVWKNR